MPPAEIDKSPQGPPTAYKSFKLLVLSNILFVFASAGYLAGAILDYQENSKNVASQGVSLSWIAILVGATSFIFVGMIDYYNTKLKIHIFLIFAGIFGTISAATEESNLQASLVFNLVSVHLFLLESLNWIWGHWLVQTNLQQNDSRKRALLIAEFGDFCFFVGALMDVCLSYYYLSEHEDSLIESQDVATARAEIVSASFWMVASLVSLSVAYRLGKQGFEGAGNDASVGGGQVASGSMA